jgi:hypothetical protein
MAHKTEIISTRQVSDEAVAITIRCCGNSKTDSTLTIYGVGRLTAEKLAADIDRHHDRVAAKCLGMASGKNLLNALGAKFKTHEG